MEIANETSSIVYILLNSQGELWFIAMKALFIAAFFAFIAMIIYCLFNTSWLKFVFFEDVSEFITYRPYGVRRIVKRWNKVKMRLDSGLESECKLAILEADNLLDEVLKKMGYAGETLLEKMKNITAATLSNIEDVKTAHKARNSIVHDPDYRLSLDEAKRIMEIYENALKNLEVF